MLNRCEHAPASDPLVITAQDVILSDPAGFPLQPLLEFDIIQTQP